MDSIPFRRPLMVLLSLGVVFGYGGAIASARWHARHGCEDRWGHHGRFDDRRFGGAAFDGRFDRFEGERAEPQRAPAAPAQPQTVVVQPAAPAAAPAPQIFIIMPGATAPQAVTQVAASAAPATP